jgi:hypothetical protein
LHRLGRSGSVFGAMFGIFAGVALLLATVGLYAVVAMFR